MRRTWIAGLVCLLGINATTAHAATCTIKDVTRTCEHTCTGTGECNVETGLGHDSCDQFIGNDDGYCTICGDGSPNNIIGTNGADFICGKGGNDTITGDNNPESDPGGDDIISGDAGTDTIFGRNGNDLVLGGTGEDDIAGGHGDDELDGGDDDDIVDGNKGNDVVRGGDGDDIVRGHVLGTNDTADLGDIICGGPQCSPTRAGLLTGRYQERFGHEFNLAPQDDLFGLHSARDDLCRSHEGRGIRDGCDRQMASRRCAPGNRVPFFMQWPTRFPKGRIVDLQRMACRHGSRSACGICGTPGVSGTVATSRRSGPRPSTEASRPRIGA